MSQNLPYDLQALQDRINLLVNNDTDTPSSGDDDWDLVLGLINQAIGNWESSGIQWDELWSTYTHGSTIAAGDLDYTLTALTDMHQPGGYVQLILDGVTSFVPVISPEEFQAYSNSVRAVYFTGNVGAGWTLNLGWTPATGDGTVGATIKFPYYKTAAKLSSSTDKPEMLDPNYIIYWVAGQKSLLESKQNQYAIYDTMSLDCMDRMKLANELKPNYNEQGVPDFDALNYGAVIGE